MKTYKLTRPKDYKGLMKVSLVDDPAIQSNLMHFSEEKEFLFADDEQRIIYAPALIPNKLIFRKNINGEPANVYFDAETIKDLHINGCRNGYDNKVNLNHESTDTDGIFCFEQWIIEDAVNDKSIKLGFELPIGTLMKGYKIDNNQVWKDVKDGKLKGLSIEGQLFPDEQKVNLKSEINMNKKGAFALAIEKLKEIFESEDDKEKDETKAFVVGEEKEEVKEEELEEETPSEEETETEDKDAKIAALETQVADLQAELAKYNETKMANEEAEVKLKADFEAEKESNVKLTAEVEKLKADVIEAKKIPVVAMAADKPYHEMTNAEKAKYNRGKL